MMALSVMAAILATAAAIALLDQRGIYAHILRIGRDLLTQADEHILLL